MPLLDHFHPPLSLRRHWENLHSAWANALRDQLNDDLLPPNYFAEVQITHGSRAEIDVATFEGNAGSTAGEGGVAVWAPPRAPFSATLQFTHPDLFEIQVRRDDGGPKLVAAVELVSPANKDRSGHRHAFAVKCASYLQEQVAVVVVDVVTLRSGNLHTATVGLLQVRDESSLDDAALYATSYRTVPRKDACGLEYWVETLAIGGDLPTVPLWLSPDLCVPLDLDQAYRRACESSRIALE
jgi:hypothetical protein